MKREPICVSCGEPHLTARCAVCHRLGLKKGMGEKSDSKGGIMGVYLVLRRSSSVDHGPVLIGIAALSLRNREL
jgi:hypothetical protein